MSTFERQLEQYMPTQAPMYRATDVDFEQWAKEGVKAVVWDVEGTLGQTGDALLEPEYVAAVDQARDAGIALHALATNRMIQNQKDRNLLASWQEQTNADLVFSPLQPNRSKPSPYMSYQAMQQFEVTPEQTGAIGDKATADMRAAYFAGIKHRAWTRPFGGNRHIGDRLVRDPFESFLRVYAHLQHTPLLAAEVSIEELETALTDDDSNLLLPITPGMNDNLDKIVGYGLPDIELDEETLASMKTPVYRQALQNIMDIRDKYGEAPGHWINKWLLEHGRTTADVLTYSRLAIAGGLVTINMSSLDRQTKQLISAALIAVAHSTDAGDGFAARRHKDGVTKRGAADDQNIDKALSAAVDLFVLIPRESISKLDAFLCIGRDYGMTELRQPFKDRGIDTASIKSGKVSTGIKAGAQFFGVTLGRRYPNANRVIQHTATAAKLGSALHAPTVWIGKHEYKQHVLLNQNR